jgi:energy-coupling factor transporter ATP-binding protein EcfA2
MHHFYLSLLVGKTVKASFNTACVAVRNAPEVNCKETDKFLLLPHGGNHDVAIFNNLPSGHYKDCTPKARPNSLRAPVDNFLGRNFELQALVEEIQKHRLVTLTGEAGIGKTALANAGARYLHRRLKFGAVYFVPCEQVCDEVGLAQLLAQEAKIELPDNFGEMQPHLARGTVMDLLVKQLASDNDTVLLILDFADCLLEKAKGSKQCVVAFLNDLFDRYKKVKVIVTCRRKLDAIHKAKENEIKLGALSPEKAAQLFSLNTNRKFSPQEYGLSEFAAHSAVKLSQHELLAKLGGHPGKITMVAQRLSQGVTFADLEQNVEELTQRYGEENALPLRATALSIDADVLAPPPVFLGQITARSSTTAPSSHHHRVLAKHSSSPGLGGGAPPIRAATTSPLPTFLGQTPLHASTTSPAPATSPLAASSRPSSSSPAFLSPSLTLRASTSSPALATGVARLPPAAPATPARHDYFPGTGVDHALLSPSRTHTMHTSSSSPTVGADVSRPPTSTPISQHTQPSAAPGFLLPVSRTSTPSPADFDAAVVGTAFSPHTNYAAFPQNLSTKCVHE